MDKIGTNLPERRGAKVGVRSMRILDEQRDCSVAKATILLTRAEAEELRDSLESVLANRRGNHAHAPSEDFQKEITVAVYDEETIDTFNERCQRLIREDV